MSRLLRGRLAALAILLAVAAPVGGQLITDESADKQDRAEDLGRSHGAARAEVDRPKPVYPLAERDRRIHGLKPFQELVDAAPAGSILKPPPGTYAGPVSVKKPLTMDEYMSARMITTPFCLYDCDRFTDASTVLIVSSGEALDEVKSKPIRIAASSGTVERHSWDQAEWPSSYPTGRDLWKRTDYLPKDVDTVQLYDGFAFQPITWLEGLGFCELGEGGRFIEGGRRIARDGELPMNTGGGQLGAGRLHGFGFAHEAVVQLRGEGGARQIPGDPRVAIATSGGGPLAAALLLAKD